MHKSIERKTHTENTVEVRGLHKEGVLVTVTALKKLLGIFLVQHRAGVVNLPRPKLQQTPASRKTLG